MELDQPQTLDDATSDTVGVLRRWIDHGDLSAGVDGRPTVVLVRDGNGRLSVLLGSDDALEPRSAGNARDPLNRLREELRAAAGRHALGGESIALRPADHVAPDAIFKDTALVRFDRSDNSDIWLLDRLQTNQDWLRPAIRIEPKIPLVVGYSIKGGVGRSTALAVLALALAKEGKRVTVIDLDLEAPGIGALLLGDELPAYGVIDWLTETLVDGESADRLIQDILFRAPAVNANALAGDVMVMPAYGIKTGNYVDKVGRAYMPSLGADGHLSRLADRLDHLVSVLAAREEPPNLILLDSRAGFHDIAAAAVVRLGAQVLVFGRDEAQSWEVYRHWLTHLQRSPQIGTTDENNDLRLRLKTVAAMVDDFGDPLKRWIKRSYDTWTTIYDEGEDSPYAFSESDEEAPHFPLPIAFTFAARRATLTDETLTDQWPQLQPAYERFVDGVKELLPAIKGGGE